MHGVVLVVVALVVVVLAEGANVLEYSVPSVSYNPDSSFSGRIDRLLNGDLSPPKSAFSMEKHYPIFAYHPNCSLELIVHTWTNVNTQLPVFGKVEVGVPTVTKSKTWKCYYRSSWLNDDENVTTDHILLPENRYLTTLVYCPSMYAEGDDGHVDVLNTREFSSFGLCPLVNNAISKEGGSSIKLVVELMGLPKQMLHGNSEKTRLEIGPVTLNSATKRSHAGGTSTRFVTSTMDKIAVQTMTGATSLAQPAPMVGDKCAAEWDAVTIVGRCFGLKTHTEYPALKHITLVESGEHCKALCCELGSQKCVTWQYWIDIKLCKLGGAVRIGQEGANTDFWCDSEKPIVWAGEKVKRLASGALDTAYTSPALTTQCFGLGNERFKRLSSPGTTSAAAPAQARMSVAECREECRASKDCGMWQAHKDRGCYYSTVSDAFCEPYMGGYTGGRRKCNDKCPK